jgi:hypothetical protein
MRKSLLDLIDVLGHLLACTVEQMSLFDWGRSQWPSATPLLFPVKYVEKRSDCRVPCRPRRTLM